MSPFLLAPILMLATAALLAWPAWRFGRRLLGPLPLFEARRLARNRWLHPQRVGFVLLLLGAIALAYAATVGAQRGGFWQALQTRPTLTLGGQATFAAQMANTFVIAQAVLLALFTVALVVGTIPAEIAGGTLDLLLATRLSRREIVLGKLAPRLLGPLSFVLAGMPVLAAMHVWGGIPTTGVLASSALAAAGVVALGCVCMFLSVATRDFWQAAFCAALAAVMGTGAIVQLSRALLDGTENTDVAATVSCLTLAVIAGAFGAAASDLLARYPGIAAAHPSPQGAEANGGPLPTPPAQPGQPSETVTDPPLTWKERRQVARVVPEEGVLALVPAAAFLLGSISSIWFEELLDLTRAFGWANLVVGGAIALGVGLLTATTVSGEREHRTLDALLLLPIERREILATKALAALRPFRWPALWLACLWLCGGVGGAFHPLALPLLALAAGIHLALVASVGLWLSVRCRTTRGAMLGLAGAAVLLGGGVSLTTGEVAAALGVEPMAGLSEGLSPPRAWLLYAFSGKDLERSWSGESYPARLCGSLLGLGLYAALAAGLWWSAFRRFDRLRDD